MPEEEILAVNVRPPTPEETALHEWFVEQEKDPSKPIDEAAKQIIQLVSALYAVLFGILAFADGPAYLSEPIVGRSGACAVLAYLFALFSALIVIVPSRYRYARASQSQRKDVFDKIMQRKVIALWISLGSFAAGSSALAVLLLSILF
jgi:hypothetical protein